jgi:hypothetical protein
LTRYAAQFIAEFSGKNDGRNLLHVDQIDDLARTDIGKVQIQKRQKKVLLILFEQPLSSGIGLRPDNRKVELCLNIFFKHRAEKSAVLNHQNTRFHERPLPRSIALDHPRPFSFTAFS